MIKYNMECFCLCFCWTPQLATGTVYSLDSPSSSRSPEPENINGNPFFSEPFAGSDLVLEVEGRQLHVHRAVLRIVSEVFDGMFSSDFVEKDRKVLPLPGKKSDDVEKLLRVIYPCFREDIDGELLGG